MKKLFIILSLSGAIVACNSSGDKSPEAAPVPAKDTVAAVAPVVDDKGLELIGSNDCTTCHSLDKKMIGPAYIDVSKKYEPTEENITMLISKVKKGGQGVWGSIPMTPHPDLAEADSRTMIKYILSLKNIH
ncbi:MAG: c-type cytochrome [Flavitalea sp.]